MRDVNANLTLIRKVDYPKRAGLGTRFKNCIFRVSVRDAKSGRSVAKPFCVHAVDYDISSLSIFDAKLKAGMHLQKQLGDELYRELSIHWIENLKIGGMY